MPYHQDSPLPSADFNTLFEYKKRCYPIADSVRALEERCQMAISLVGEILATLQLEGNAHLFNDFPDDWSSLVDNWQRSIQAIAADPGTAPRD